MDDASHSGSGSGDDQPQQVPSPPAGTGDSSAPLCTGMRREATQAEIDSLPHVADKVPFAAWAVILAGAAERFTYFGIISPWRKRDLFLLFALFLFLFFSFFSFFSLFFFWFVLF